MQLQKILKGFAFLLPVLALAACSATEDTTADTESERTTEEREATEERRGVETGAADREMTPEEQRQERYAELRQDHIVNFDFDRSEIRSEFTEMLAAHADYLVRNPSVSVVIEGHTDERGTPEYNIALGERRAKSVAEYLQNLGVLSSQIENVSYGEEKPLVRESNEEAWAQNRRAVLVY